MISFQFDRTDTLSWLLIVGLLLMLAIQVWLILRNEALSGQRKALRLVLNGLLWLSLLTYTLRPVWNVTSNTSHVLLVSDDVPSDVRQKFSDSLKLKAVVTARTFDGNRFDSVTVLGQEFQPEFLSGLSRQAIRWIPYYAPDQLQAIRWKGIVQKGEIQQVTGTLQSSKKQRIKLAYAGRVLDSLDLAGGVATFNLKFPVFTVGRTETELVLDRTPLDTVRFFARSLKPLTYQFILSTPDFESKTLADWLGKNGNSVQMVTTLSKDISNKLTINKATAKPDIIITDPSNAGNVAVKRAIADGKAVLFINLSNPETDCRLINQALGSRWQVRKISNEALISVGTNTGLQALPYSFAANAAQTIIPGYPAAIQRSTGKIGVSLLNETFPLKLSGDSLAYNRFWNAMIAQLQPAASTNSQIEAPVLEGVREQIVVNNVATRPAGLIIDKDTIPLTYSPINALSAAGKWRVKSAGWIPAQDSLAIYAEKSGFSTVAKSVLVQRYMAAHAADQMRVGSTPRLATVTVPDWVWLVILLVCFTALWVEPKLG